MRPRPRSGRLAPAHQEALDRRLVLLEAELAASGRGGPGEPREQGEPGGPGGRSAPPRAAPEHTRVRPAIGTVPVASGKPVPWSPPEWAPPEGEPPEGEPPQPLVGESSGQRGPEERAGQSAATMVPPALPVPGRHAAPRRPRSRRWSVGRARPLLDRAAGDAGRWALGASQLLVVALVVVLGLAVTAWWVVRSEPEPVAPVGPITPAAPLVPVTSGAAAAPGGSEVDATPEPAVAPAPGASPTAEVVVHVAGKVRRPGLVVLPAGARVADAVDAAGGAGRGADLTALNLARLLVDGEQVLVGLPAQVAGPSGGVPGASSGRSVGVPQPATALVDLNTADQTLLETLPGVGPVTATAIIDWRTEHGGFTAVEELLEVDGIGDATLADLAPLVTV